MATNVTAFQELTKTQPAGYQKRVQTFTENGEDMTHMTAPQKLATTSSFKVDIFSTIGEFYPVDTYQVKNDLTAATGKYMVLMQRTTQLHLDRQKTNQRK